MILFTTPILILGFRRPANIVKIVDAIRPHSPQKIFFAVDGHRQGKVEEQTLVLQTQKAIESIDWECDVRVRFRDQNLGIRKAVPDAVSWVLDSNPEVIVIEDDAIPGPDLLDFMKNQLENFRDDSSVAHVSGYNLVPREKLSRPSDLIRRSIYPESYLWGTWARVWTIYNDNVDDYQSIVQEMNLNQVEKLIWRINFRMAQKDLIQTWAYRWIASMWRENKVCISPNANLTTYVGRKDGTHTRKKSRSYEQEVTEFFTLESPIPTELDSDSDRWLSRNIFHASLRGLVVHAFTYVALAVIRFASADRN